MRGSIGIIVLPGPPSPLLAQWVGQVKCAHTNHVSGQRAEVRKCTDEMRTMHGSQCPARTLGQMPRSILRDAAPTVGMRRPPDAGTRAFPGHVSIIRVSVYIHRSRVLLVGPRFSLISRHSSARAQRKFHRVHVGSEKLRSFVSSVGIFSLSRRILIVRAGMTEGRINAMRAGGSVLNVAVRHDAFIQSGSWRFAR